MGLGGGRGPDGETRVGLTGLTLPTSDTALLPFVASGFICGAVVERRISSLLAVSLLRLRCSSCQST